MYGLIFTTVKDLVLKKFGEAVWLDLLAKAGITQDFVENKNYDDQVIYTLLTVAAQELNTTVPELLEAIGYWFPIYVKSTAYGKVLSSAGNSLKEILTNINTMHGHIKMGYFSEMRPPTFRITREKANKMQLHYLSGVPTRKGLSPLVVGIIKGLGEEHLQLSALKIKQKKWIDKGAEEDVFSVKWKISGSAKKRLLDESVSTTPLVYGLDPQGLNKAFPFHFIFNQKLEILQCGKSLSRLVPMMVGDQVTNFFELVSPARASFTDWKFLTNRGKTEVFVFKHAYDDYKSLKLKGQLIWQPMLRSMCFVGSPLLTSLEDLDYFGLNLSDFAAHDPTKDALFMGHAKDANLHASDPQHTDAASTLASSLSSSSSDITLASDSSYVSLQSSDASSSSPTPIQHSSVNLPGLGVPLSSVTFPLSESSPPSPHGHMPAVPPPSPLNSFVLSPRIPQSNSDSTHTHTRRPSSAGGCPFSAVSSSASALPTLKSNSRDRPPAQHSPPPTTAASPPAPLRSPVTSSSLLDKLFGSKQKSSYSPKATKADKDKGLGLLHTTGGINGKSAPRPQPLRALLSAAGNGLIGSSGQSTNSSATSSVDDPGKPDSGRKRSKSCSDSDELLVIDDEQQLPLVPGDHKLHAAKPKPGRRGVIPDARLSDRSVSDEETPRSEGRSLRASPQHAIPPAGPLSLHGRERLENAFQELLLDDSRRNFKLVMELLNLTYAESSVDKLVHALLEFYNYHGKTINFLQKAIELDVRSANEEGVLMRSETVGTRVLSLYISGAGREYVRELVDPLMARIASAVAAKLEVLPNRAPSDKHTAVLLELSQAFLEQTCRSADDCPLGIRRVLHMVGEEVGKRWPQMQQSGILNLLFLRLLTPAILSSSGVNDTTRRVQLLVTKLIQNLANDVPFDGRKEEHMKAFNAFINDSNQRLLQAYVAALTDEEAIHDAMNYQASMSRYTPTPPPDYVAAEEALGTIRDTLTVHLDKVWKLALTDDHTGTMLRRFLSVGLCQMYSSVGRT